MSTGTAKNAAHKTFLACLDATGFSPIDGSNFTPFPPKSRALYDRGVAEADAAKTSPDPRASAARALADRYRTLFVLGRGGMGTVEAALEVASDGGYRRVVALKRALHKGGAGTTGAAMFLREARIAALLRHPNVVTALDYGDADGELYLAMEYVEGQPLSRIIQALRESKGTFTLVAVAHVVASLCEGLHAAHELTDQDGRRLHVIHRDVSPQNVMVGYDGTVRLVDFGVAKMEAESVTKTGEVKGKAAYMSPEQAMGDPVDPRSDLFGVGAVLFECIALERMWGQGTEMEVIRKLALEVPPKLPTADARLASLYERLVARAAGDRPTSARAVAESLRALFPAADEEGPRLLSEMLAELFGSEAEAQRQKLAEALDELAPSQAMALRGSLVPIARTSRVSLSPRRSAERTDRRSRWAAVIALGVLLAAIVVYAVRALPAVFPNAAATPIAVSSAPVVVAPTASAASIATTASAVDAPPASAPASIAMPNPTRATSPGIVAAPPTVRVRAPAAASSTGSPTSASSPPSPPRASSSAPEPLDVDKNPF
jgi:serine/threonine-protein kinase